MSELRKEIEDCAKSIRISEEKLIKLRDRHEIMSKMHQPSNLDLYHNFEIYVDAVEHKEYEFTEQLGGDGRSQPIERQVKAPAIVCTVRPEFYLTEEQRLIVRQYYVSTTDYGLVIVHNSIKI